MNNEKSRLLKIKIRDVMNQNCKELIEEAKASTNSDEDSTDLGSNE